MSKRGLKFIVFVQCLLFLSPTNLFNYKVRDYNFGVQFSFNRCHKEDLALSFMTAIRCKALKALHFRNRYQRQSLLSKIVPEAGDQS